MYRINSIRKRAAPTRAGLAGVLSRVLDGDRGKVLLHIFRSAVWVVISSRRMRPRMSLRERTQVQTLFEDCGGISSIATLTSCAQSVGIEMPEGKMREIWGEGSGGVQSYYDGQIVKYCRFYQLFEHAKRESIKIGKVDDMTLMVTELGDRDLDGVLHDFGLSAGHSTLTITQDATPSKGKARRKGARNDGGDWWTCVEEGDWVSGTEAWASGVPQVNTRIKRPPRVFPLGAVSVTPKQDDIDVSDDDVEEPTRRVDDHGSTLAILARLGIDVESLQYTTSAPPSRKASFALPPRPASTISTRDPAFMGAKQKMPHILGPLPRPLSSQSRAHSRQSRPSSALSFVDRMHEDVMSRRMSSSSARQNPSSCDGSFAVPIIHSGNCISEPPQPFPIDNRMRPVSPYRESRPVSAVPFSADTAAIHPPRCVPTRTTAQSGARYRREQTLAPDVLHRVPFDLCPAARHRSTVTRKKAPMAAHGPSKVVAADGDDPLMLRWLSGGQLRTGT